MRARLELKASYTVEAAVIFPLLCLLLFTFMTLTFYMHDLITQDALAAYVTEEGRMALIHSKVPGDCSIYAKGFSGESSSSLLLGMLSPSVTEASENCYFVKPSKYSTDISQGDFKTKSILTSRSRFYMLLPKKLSAKELISFRTTESPFNNLRKTNLIYNLYQSLKK